jgi:hypothetical protein
LTYSEEEREQVVLTGICASCAQKSDTELLAIGGKSIAVIGFHQTTGSESLH